MKRIDARYAVFLLASALAVSSCARDEITVDHLSPSLGLTAGGTKVSIQLDGIVPEGEASVIFGDRSARLVAFDESGLIETTAPPADEEGPVDVRVIIDGRTELLISGMFTYVEKDEMAECINITNYLNKNELPTR